MDDNNFYISNFIKSLTIPRTEVNTVKYIYIGYASAIPYMELHMKSHTLFGSTIKFFPSKSPSEYHWREDKKYGTQGLLIDEIVE